MQYYVVFRRGALVLFAFLSVSCGNDENLVNPPSPGSIRVTVATTGDDPDANGYMVSVDAGEAHVVEANGSVTISNQTVGSHTIELGGVASNCTVQGDNPRTVAVNAGSSTAVSIAVTCSALVGDLRVSTSTTGEDLDPDAFMLSLDGGTPEPMAINAERTFASLSAGVHELELSGISENCSVAGGSIRTVTVQAGGTEAVTFAVTCTRAVGSIRVTATTTGFGLDQGYLVSVDGGPPQDLDANDSGSSASGQVVFSDLALGDHTIALTDIQGNCVVDGENPRVLTVVFDQTTEMTVSVTCSAIEITPGGAPLQGSVDSDTEFFKFYVPEGGDFSVTLESSSGPGSPVLALEDAAGNSVEASDGTTAWIAGTGPYCTGNPATASFSDQPAGWYLAMVRGVRDCDDATGMTTEAVVDDYTFAVEPGVPANVVVELYWSEENSDMDAHVTGPIGFTGERFLVYWNNRGSLDALPYAWYAVDAPVYGAQPEFIQLSRQMDEVYRFYARVSPITPEGTQLVVRLLIDGALVQEFTYTTTLIPLGFGNWEGDNLWLAFELTGSTITPIETAFECRADPGAFYETCFD